MITIEFNYSKSRAGHDAIINSLDFSEPEELKDGKNTILRIKLSKQNIRKAFPFLKALKRLKNKKIFVDGIEMPFDQVFGFLPCYQEKLRLGTRGYCFGQDDDGCSSHNIFGCVASTLFDFGRYGKWKNKTQRWTFNKKKMREALALEVEHCTHCPAFDAQRMNKVIDSIPISINPIRDKAWQFLTVDSFDKLNKKIQIVEVKRPKSTEIIPIVGVRIGTEVAIERISKKAGFNIPIWGYEWVNCSSKSN